MLLYVWFMMHLRPIGIAHRHGYCFRHGISMSYSFCPTICMDEVSWFTFLSYIEESFSILFYLGYCSPLSFITHAAGMDFFLIVNLWGVTTYHSMAIMGQFDQYQDFQSFNGTLDHRPSVFSLFKDNFARVYEFCVQHETTKF